MTSSPPRRTAGSPSRSPDSSPPRRTAGLPSRSPDRPPARDLAPLAEALRHQHQVIARDQALACGVTERSLRWRARAGGPWQRLLRGVYLTHTGNPTADQLDTAALLHAGPGSLLTAFAALRRLGFRVPPLEAVDVLVPRGRQAPSAGFVRVHRTARMPELVCVSGPVRYVLAARAVADAARGLSVLSEVRALVAASVQEGWCRLVELTDELAHGPAAGSGLLRRVLAEVADGIRSAAEAEFRDLIKRAGLPMPVFNARLFAGSTMIGVADAWWPGLRVAAEVDSREWHLSPADWERTLRRHARLTAEGILMLHFTPRQIRTEPAEVVATLRAALAAERAGRPIRALPASA